jgi:hypothetical protein
MILSAFEHLEYQVRNLDLARQLRLRDLFLGAQGFDAGEQPSELSRKLRRFTNADLRRSASRKNESRPYGRPSLSPSAMPLLPKESKCHFIEIRVLQHRLSLGFDNC